jgi:hypothetical protein
LGITHKEWAVLAQFVAFQAVLTPFFRRPQQKQYADLMKAITQRRAANPRMWEANWEAFCASRKEHSNSDSEELRRFILGGEYDIEYKGDYLLGLTVPDVCRDAS